MKGWGCGGGVGRDEETKKKRKEETKRKEKMKVNKLHLAPRITRTRIHSKKGTAPEGGKGCSSLFALSLTFTFSLFLSFFLLLPFSLALVRTGMAIEVARH